MAEDDYLNDTGTSVYPFFARAYFRARRSGKSSEPSPEEVQRLLKQIESQQAMERQIKQARSKRFVPHF